MKKQHIFMKQHIISFFVLLAVVWTVAGCGKVSRGTETEGKISEDTDIMQEVPKATKEMNEENKDAQKDVLRSKKTETPPPEEENNSDIKEQDEAKVLPKASKENSIQIVFLGDSIFDSNRDHTGIPYITGLLCNADVYNMAMGGTSAALTEYEKAEFELWTSRSLQGVVHAICGNISAGILDGYQAGEILAACDFGKTDYFVIEYGINDFLNAIPLNNDSSERQQYTYVGALRNAISTLRENYPDAQIVLCSPAYAQFWGEDGVYLGDGNMADMGGGTLVSYYRVCGNVSADEKTLFLNAYDGIGIDAYTADEYLVDGIHLSEKGRKKYAEELSEVILNFEATRNN